MSRIARKRSHGTADSDSGGCWCSRWSRAPLRKDLAVRSTVLVPPESQVRRGAPHGRDGPFHAYKRFGRTSAVVRTPATSSIRLCAPASGLPLPLPELRNQVICPRRRHPCKCFLSRGCYAVECI